MTLIDTTPTRGRPASVRELMTSFVISVPRDASLARAARLIDCYRVTGLPVVDEDGVAVGVISQRDLLRAMIDGRDRDDWRHRKVRELMSSPALSIDDAAGADEAARLMDAHRVHRLLVLDRRGAPRGVLSRSDLARSISRG